MVAGSNNLKNGSQSHTLPELLQAHVKIEFLGASPQGISEKIIEYYKQGYSIREIRSLTGKAYSSIHTILVRERIELRPSVAEKATSTWSEVGKRSVRPPYGFCYFQGKVVADPKEYENLLLIHRWWKEGVNPNSIADRLNAKKIAPRSASAWNRNSVVNIIKRFETKTILLKGDQYELR